MNLHFSTAKLFFSGLFLSLLFLLNTQSVYAATCNPPQVGDYSLPESCAFDGEINGVYKGDLSIPTDKTLTINPNQTIIWSADGSINLAGGNIIVSETGQLKQANLPETILSRLGFDTYAAGAAVRIFGNNLFVCLSEPCTATDPGGAGNVIIEGLLKITGGNPGAGKVLTSAADGVASWQAPAGVPSGVVNSFAGNAPPNGWLLCNGQAVSRTAYADLFAVIGTTYGAGDGSTTFNLPDLRGRFPLGQDNMGGVSADTVTNAQADVLGGTEGEENHTLTVDEMPNHTHTAYKYTNYGIGSGAIAFTQQNQGQGSGNTLGAGADQPHNNMPPYMALNYIIKY